MSQENMHNKDLGYRSEEIARIYYERLGWNLIIQNKTERGSELDLVMEKKHMARFLKSNQRDEKGAKKDIRVTREILFVEVKSVTVNKNGSFGYDNIAPEDNFTRSKQKFLKRGMELYLTKNKLYKEEINIRIDLACVYYHQKENKWTIKTYENIILD